MNELIQSIFSDFAVGGVKIPVRFLKYEGHETQYVIYSQVDADNSLSADDELQNYVMYYDFDVFSKGNYFPIIDAITEKLTQNGFVWQPSRSSKDMYEADTGYYHRTLNFAKIRKE